MVWDIINGDLGPLPPGWEELVIQFVPSNVDTVEMYTVVYSPSTVLEYEHSECEQFVSYARYAQNADDPSITRGIHSN